MNNPPRPHATPEYPSGEPNPGRHYDASRRDAGDPGRRDADAALVERWRTLLAELDRARRRFNQTHVSLVSRMEALHNGGRQPAPRAHDLDAHDDAAAAWIIARDALIQFCRQHPQVC